MVNGRSAFNFEDFKENRKVFRNDFTVGVDGRRPYRCSSYRCTGEGVSTGATKFIVNGRLKSPILNLKYAPQMGMGPTAIPLVGAKGLILDLPVYQETYEILVGLGEALIVHSVLGLYTQDYTTGKISLKADQCLLVIKGSVLGKTQAVIVGDFFAALASEDTTFFRFSYEKEVPAYCFRAHVVF